MACLTDCPNHARFYQNTICWHQTGGREWVSGALKNGRLNASNPCCYTRKMGPKIRELSRMIGNLFPICFFIKCKFAFWSKPLIYRVIEIFILRQPRLGTVFFFLSSNIPFHKLQISNLKNWLHDGLKWRIMRELILLLISVCIHIWGSVLNILTWIISGEFGTQV